MSTSQAPTDPRLHTNLAGLSLASPLVLAAGTAGTLDELSSVLDLSRIGAITTKSLTRHSRKGNTPPRIIESRVGMLNAIGLANPGIDAFIEHTAQRMADLPTNTIVSIAGFTIDEFVHLAAAIDLLEHVAAVELNVSCPNVAHGCAFGADPNLLADLVKAVRPALPTTRLIVKLSPVAIGTPHTIVDLAKAAIESGAEPVGPLNRPGADVLTIGNTIPAMAVDVDRCVPRLSTITGGLSGPALHPVTLKLVYDAHRSICSPTGTPIIATGGVLNWRDAAAYILAGAHAVGMGTALFVNPRLPLRINKGLSKWVKRQGESSITALVGALNTEEIP